MERTKRGARPVRTPGRGSHQPPAHVTREGPTAANDAAAPAQLLSPPIRDAKEQFRVSRTRPPKAELRFTQ